VVDLRNNVHVRHLTNVRQLDLSDIENLIAASFYAKRLKKLILRNLDFEPRELKTLKGMLPLYVNESKEGRYLNREETRKGTGYIHLTIRGVKSMTVAYFKDSALFVTLEAANGIPRRITNRKTIVKTLNEMIEELVVG
jgi:hypothetical protein